jgi:teichuronic acid biosynthesis glycosyltransferase TuaH
MLNFVIFSLSRWNENFGCNIRDISYELAKQHRVLFIDVPLKRKEKWFNKKNSDKVIEVLQRETSGTNLVKVSENLWHYIDFSVLESVNSIGNSKVFDFINRINNRRFANVIENAVSNVNFDEYILLNDNDIYNGLYLHEHVRPLLYVYYLRDRLSAMSYWKKHAARLESRLIKQVDLVVANSLYLSDSAALINKNSFYIGQGCDIDHFDKRPSEVEINETAKGLRRPVIGYIGALNSERLDISLIYELATRLPDFSFVLVGKEDFGFEQSDLRKLKNIHFTGNKAFAELPRYLYSFDVSINPQRVNDITIGNYPRKIDEFLAAGIPVVATETPTMIPFSDHVYLGRTVDDFVNLIQRAISEDTPEKRIERKKFAANHNWKNSVELMMNHVLAAIELKSGEKHQRTTRD